LVSTDAAECIREWHDVASRVANRVTASGQTFVFRGMTLIVPPRVQQITGARHLLGEAVLAEVSDGDRVLDIGTGSGINAILAASRGAYVVAVDLSPEARDAAQENAERSGLAKRIEIKQSDLFTEVEGPFDIIVYEPHVRGRSLDERREVAATSESPRGVAIVVRQARRHLSSSGRILFFVGPSSDRAQLMEVAAEEGFTSHLIAQEGLIRDGVTVDYFTFGLTSRSEPEGG
jgi:release factor glutamine methyltransferase